MEYFYKRWFGSHHYEEYNGHFENYGNIVSNYKGARGKSPRKLCKHGIIARKKKEWGFR